MFLQAVLSVKLKVLSKIKELQSLSFALNLNIRLFAVASNMLATIIEHGQVTVQEKEIPSPGPGEALVRVHLAGVCNTDLEILAGYVSFIGTLGHEFVGRVVQAPEHPELMAQRVVADINSGCGHCSWCLQKKHRHCLHRKVLGIRGLDGAFAHYIRVPVANLYPVPDQVPDEEAVFAEPLAAALEIGQQVHITAQTRVAVLGDGKLGLLCALALSHYSPRLRLFGRHPAKLGIAAAQDIATCCLDSGQRADPEDTGFDLVVDCTGQAQGIDTALDFVRPEGTVVLKTTSTDPSTVNMSRVVVNEISLLGSRCGDMGFAVHFLAHRWISVWPLIHKVFPLSFAPMALDQAGQKGALKVLIDCR
jgi:threonine dehydrogenase-like Zn-dependent dehydrogenase